MIDISTLVNRGLKEAVKNAPEILTAFGMAGVAMTAYLTGKASFRAANKLNQIDHDNDQDRRDLTGDPWVDIYSFRKKVEIVWPEFVPPVLACTATIACIYGSHRSSNKRYAAAVAAYSLSEKAFTEYKEKVQEKLGEKKEKQVVDEVATEKVQATPRVQTEMPVFPTGDVLCCDLLTMRYFQSDIESINKAVNKLNERLLKEGWMSVAEFYYLIGVRPTDHMDRLGWTSDRLMEVDFTAVMTEEDPPRPCAAFNYNYVQPV